jgi:hypothetical protein
MLLIRDAGNGEVAHPLAETLMPEISLLRSILCLYVSYYCPHADTLHYLHTHYQSTNAGPLALAQQNPEIMS